MKYSQYLQRVLDVRQMNITQKMKTVYTSPAMSKLIGHAQRLEERVEELEKRNAAAVAIVVGEIGQHYPSATLDPETGLLSPFKK